MRDTKFDNPFNLSAIELATILPLTKKDGESAEKLSSCSAEHLENYHGDKSSNSAVSAKGCVGAMR